MQSKTIGVFVRETKPHVKRKILSACESGDIVACMLRVCVYVLQWPLSSLNQPGA